MQRDIVENRIAGEPGQPASGNDRPVLAHRLAVCAQIAPHERQQERERDNPTPERQTEWRQFAAVGAPDE
jgi:hypothetical protein